jgi:hypothetical protein
VTLAAGAAAAAATAQGDGADRVSALAEELRALCDPQRVHEASGALDSACKRASLETLTAARERSHELLEAVQHARARLPDQPAARPWFEHFTAARLADLGLYQPALSALQRYDGECFELADAKARLYALHGSVLRGELEYLLGDVDAALATAARAEAESRALGDAAWPQLADALTLRGRAHVYLGLPDVADESIAAALEQARAAGDGM